MEALITTRSDFVVKDGICETCSSVDFDGFIDNVEGGDNYDMRNVDDERLSWECAGRFAFTLRIDHISPGLGCRYCDFFNRIATTLKDEAPGGPIRHHATLLCMSITTDRLDPRRRHTRREVTVLRLSIELLDQYFDRQYTFPWGRRDLRYYIPQDKIYCAVAPPGSVVDFTTIMSGTSQIIDAHHGSLTHSWEVDFKRLLLGWRVIDCETLRVVRLKECVKTFASFADMRYVALSYVWGSSREESRVEGGRLPRILPRVVCDAIAATKQLQFRFLWIDRYCVPQDDAAELHAQVRHMDLIYARASLTLIAVAGDGPEYGLPGVGDTKRHYPFPTFVLGSKFLVQDPPADWTQIQVQESVWNQRGWTYQEAILSRARLFFTDSFLLLEDQDGSSIDGLGRATRICPDYGGGLTDGLQLLERHAQNYCRRFLSYEEDAFNAFRGIQNLLSDEQLRSNVFFYGLLLTLPWLQGVPSSTEPTVHFAPGLCWTFEGKASGALKRRIAAPSWTWIGWHLPPTAQVEGPTWFRKNPKYIEYNDDADFSLEFNDGRVYRLHSRTEAQLRSIKAAQDDSDVRFLHAIGMTFGLEAISPKPMDDGISGAQQAVVRENATVEAHIPNLGSSKLLERIQDRAAIHGHVGEELFKHSNILFLLLGHVLTEDMPNVYDTMVLSSRNGGESYERIDVIKTSGTSIIDHTKMRDVKIT